MENKNNVPTKLMFDTNVFDSVIDDPELFAAIVKLQSLKQIKILTTIIQEEELARTPSMTRRRSLQAVPREVVPPETSVDSEDYSGEHMALEKPFVGIHGIVKHHDDYVICMTAMKHADAVVTADQYFSQWLKEFAPSFPVWSVQDLRDFVDRFGTSPRTSR